MLVGRPGADSLSAADLIGQQLGDYRLIERIGSGGMGVVYLAEHVHLRKRYAVKVLPFELADDPGFVARFHDEARVMAELRHERIVQVHSMSRAVIELSGEQRTVYFLAMDYVAGPTGRPLSLHEQLKLVPDGRLPEAQTRTWAIQISEALAYAHQRGLVHRDLKPANILIDAAGNVKLTDFGLAKAVGQEFILSQIHETMQRSLGSLPTVGSGGQIADVFDAAASPAGEGSGSARSSGASSILGTYDYMAPEQRGETATEIGPWTDVYALGVVLYRLLTGRRPSGLARRPSRVVPGLSRRWDRIVSRCMAPEPSERYPSAGELMRELRTVRVKCRRRRLPGWLLLGPALLVAALLTVLLIYGPAWLARWQLYQAQAGLLALGRLNTIPELEPLEDCRSRLLKATQEGLGAVAEGALPAARDTLDRVRAGLAALEAAREAWNARPADDPSPEMGQLIEAPSRKFQEGLGKLEPPEDFQAARSDFESARKAYQGAAAQLEAYKQQAEDAQRIWQHAFQQANRELLEGYAGKELKQANDLAEKARDALASKRFQQAARDYEEAVKALGNARKEALRLRRQELKQQADKSRAEAQEAAGEQYAADLMDEAQALVEKTDQQDDEAAIRGYQEAISKFEEAAETAQRYSKKHKQLREQLEKRQADETFAVNADQYAREKWTELQRLAEQIPNLLRQPGSSADARQQIDTGLALIREIAVAIERGLCAKASEDAQAVCAPSLAPEQWKQAERAKSELKGSQPSDAPAKRWRQVKDIYDEARRQAEELRTRYLKELQPLEAGVNNLIERNFLLPNEREELQRLVKDLKDRFDKCTFDDWRDRIAWLEEELNKCRNSAANRRRFADARTKLLKQIADNEQLCKQHGGRLAGQSNQIKARWDRREWQEYRPTWADEIKADEQSVTDAVRRLKAIDRLLSDLRAQAQEARIDLDVQPDFIGYQQWRAAMKIREKLDRAEEPKANPNDKQVERFRGQLANWTKLPDWQFNGTDPQADPIAARRAAAEHFRVPEQLKLALGNRTSIELVLVPPGWISVAGQVIEMPQPLLVSVTELTRGQWAALYGTSLKGSASLPKAGITWVEANDACRKFSRRLSQQTSLPPGPCRLPTPTEWVYLAAGGERGPDAWYADPDRIGERTWYVANSEGTVHRVGTGRKANGWGLFNILGNVQEWCSDPSATESAPSEIVYRPVCGVSCSQPLPSISERLLLDCREQHQADKKEDTIGMRIVVEVGKP